VQIAKAMGAWVTAVCRTDNVELVRSLGADRVYDYTQQDFTQDDLRYDLVLEIASTRPWRHFQRVMKPEARFVIVGAPGKGLLGPLGRIFTLWLSSRRSSQLVKFFVASFNRADLKHLAKMIEDGKVRPVIDSTFPLERAADAMRRLGTAHARGKVVITI
jgi:NADPH:quinone reductase-like Zn-dependent oxidoreductase